MPKKKATIVTPIDTLLVHEGAHPDEHVGATLLSHFGEELYPGAKKAKISEFSGGILKPGDLPKNIKGVGIGGEEFDEHGKPGNHCATTLVAQKLNLLTHQPLVHILLQTLIDDNHASCGWKNTIAFLVKTMNMMGVPFEKIHAWYQTVFWAEYRQQQRLIEKGEFNQEYQDVLNYILSKEERINLDTDPWGKRIKAIPQIGLETGYELVKADLGEAKADSWKALADSAIVERQIMFLNAEQEWLQNGKRQRLETNSGTLDIGFMRSNSPVMNSVARFCRPNTRWSKVDLFVQMNTAGNALVFTDAKLGIDLTELTRNIRLAEGKKRGTKVKDIQSISTEGTHPEFPMWHLLEGSHSMLFNGSLSATMIEPTVLTPSELLEIIKETFCRKENRFEIPSSAFKPAKPAEEPVDPSVFTPRNERRSLEGALVH